MCAWPCTCVLIDMHLCVYMHICKHVHVKGGGQPWVPQEHHAPSLRQDLSLAWSSPISLDWLASTFKDHHASASAELRLQVDTITLVDYGHWTKVLRLAKQTLSLLNHALRHPSLFSILKEVCSLVLGFFCCCCWDLCHFSYNNNILKIIFSICFFQIGKIILNHWKTLVAEST